MYIYKLTTTCGKFNLFELINQQCITHNYVCGSVIKGNAGGNQAPYGPYPR